MIGKLSRRSFLTQAAAGAATLSAGSLQLSGAEIMPKRTLGRTGLKIPILSFGGGSQFLLAKDGEWEQMMETALASGIDYFDTSSNYQWKAAKSSEERFGEILSGRRKSVLISTKFEAREPDKAKAEIERSLKRLKTDYVDILLIHSIEPSEDIGALEKGVYSTLRKLKEEKTARFIGFSSMNSAAKSREVLEKLEIDVTILAMNATQYGDFAKIALPVAREKNVGVIAMKLMRGLVGANAPPKDLLYYAWSQPGVAAGVVGHVSASQLSENMRIAASYTPGKASAFDRQELERQLAPLAGPHALCWARKDYKDSDLA